MNQLFYLSAEQLERIKPFFPLSLGIPMLVFKYEMPASDHGRLTVYLARDAMSYYILYF